jgi:hypothetical protein
MCALSRRERRPFEEKRGDAVVPNDRETIGCRPAARVAGRLRERHQAQAVGHPSRDRQHPAVGEVIEIVVERLDGVERVLGQRVRARRRGRPGVDERRLDDVVAFRRPPHEAASIVHGDADARVRVDAAGKLAQSIRASPRWR